MSKSLIAVIGLVALIGSAAQAAEPAKRRLNTVTFTQSVSTTNTALGSWAKVDGLATSWDVSESQPPRGDRMFRSRSGHSLPAKGRGRNQVAVEGITGAEAGGLNDDFVVVKQLDASSTKLQRSSGRKPATQSETVTLTVEDIQRVSASAGSRVPDGTSNTVFLAERPAR